MPASAGLGDGGVRAREITLRRKDGKPVVCLDTSRAVWDPAGQIIAAMNINAPAQTIDMPTLIREYLPPLMQAAKPPPRLTFTYETPSEQKRPDYRLVDRTPAQKTANAPLGSFGNHNALIAHREGDGSGEVHLKQADVFIVQTGEATLRVGGELVDGKQLRPNEMGGPSVRGAKENVIRAGDVIQIPAGVPHQMLVKSGQQITYMVVKIDQP